MIQAKITSLYNHMFSDRRPPWLRNIIDSYLYLDWLGMQLNDKAELFGQLHQAADVEQARQVLHIHWLFEQEIEMAYKEGFCRG